jgi:tRNA threonylcarbamoyladenosine biosynthesis protein TsaE
MTHTTRSEEETRVIAQQLAERLRPGDVVLLSGPLGAGKTAFVRGLAAGLGVDPREVTSPTFTLLHEYRPETRPHGGDGPALVLYHADLYRLEGAATEDLGLEETATGVLAIEWPERLAVRPTGAIEVALEITGNRTRTITIREAAVG